MEGISPNRLDTNSKRNGKRSFMPVKVQVLGQKFTAECIATKTPSSAFQLGALVAKF